MDAHHDLRSAFRQLRHRPGYALVVVATLALGIGAATVVFTLIDGVLMRPLPYPEADRLVLIRQRNPQNEWNTSVVDFQAIQAQQRSFDAVAAYRVFDVVLTGTDRARWVNARWVTTDFFRVLGVAPAYGHAFQAGENREGAERAVVLGHAFAKDHFGAGVDPLGQALTLDGETYTVVGIMPPGVEELAGMRTDLWPALQLAEPERRGPFLLGTVARLKPGVTQARAAGDLAAISRRIFPEWQAGFQDETARLTPRSLHEAVIGDAGGVLRVAFGAVLVVLLLAVVNIANVVLVRVTERAQELSVRATLGASRRRLARLLAAGLPRRAC
ncbi:MAG: ABC transporter permease [Thermoanaerobaculia bacterium]